MIHCRAPMYEGANHWRRIRYPSRRGANMRRMTVEQCAQFPGEEGWVYELLMGD
jgi:hypothetical protein